MSRAVEGREEDCRVFGFSGEVRKLSRAIPERTLVSATLKPACEGWDEINDSKGKVLSSKDDCKCTLICSEAMDA